MPELPEVETVVRELRHYLIGQRIESVTVLNPSSFVISEPMELFFPFEISCIQRRCKYIIFESIKKHSIIAHLRMTGKFLVTISEKEKPYCRLILHLSSEKKLYFVDLRKFARIECVTDCEKRLEKLGRDANSKAITADDFYLYLQSKKKSVKPVLLDQQVFCGIGNIYADEALFQSRISPLRLSSSLSRMEAATLLSAIQFVLNQAIDRMGTSISDYRRTDNLAGENQNYLQVYGQKVCKQCYTKIQKIKLSGRGTHFCATCQH